MGNKCANSKCNNQTWGDNIFCNKCLLWKYLDENKNNEGIRNGSYGNDTKQKSNNSRDKSRDKSKEKKYEK